MSKSLHESLVEYLEACGHAVTVVPFPDNGDHRAIRFCSKGQRFQVNVYGDDPQFLHIMYGYRLPERRPSDDVLRRIALGVQDDVKAAKLSVDGDFVVSHVEQIISGESFQPIFWRCADLAENGARDFCERLGRAPLDHHAEAQAAAERFISSLDLGASSKDAAEPKKRPRTRKSKGVKQAPKTGPSDPSPTT